MSEDRVRLAEDLLTMESLLDPSYVVYLRLLIRLIDSEKHRHVSDSKKMMLLYACFFFSSRRRHTILVSDWSSDVCSSDLVGNGPFRFGSCVTNRKGPLPTGFTFHEASRSRACGTLSSRWAGRIARSVRTSGR